MPFEHHVIEYFQDNDLKLGWVAREQKSKLLVVDRTGRNDRVTPANVLLSHGPVAGGRAAFAAFAQRVEDRVLALAAEIDTELLWESLSGRDREYSAEELAAEYFEESTPVHAAAAARAVLRDPIRFRRIRTRFRLRSREEVEQGRMREARQAANAALRERAVRWLREVLAGDDAPSSVPAAAPAGLEPTVRKIEDYVLAGGAPEAEGLLAEAVRGRPPRGTGVELLARLGRLPTGVDRWLLERGAFPAFPKSVEAAAAALVEYSPEPGRTDYGGLPTFSIDDADTREIDDALSVEIEGDRLVVGVHIADPSVFVRRDDPVDRAAARRPLSLYLPTTVLPMLPERIGCGLASLNAGRLRPSLSFRLVFDGNDQLIEWDVHPGQVRVSRRLTYAEAGELLEQPGDDQPAGDALRRLARAAMRRRSVRLEQGALVLVRPEPKIHVRDGRIRFQLLDSNSPARQLVAEMMILVNSLAALYALRHDVPVIYRVQAPPKNTIKPMAEYDPVAFDAAVRSIGRSRFSTHPQPHAGLGVDLYMQLSSPVRRYSDMVLQRQLAAHFRGEPFPYTRTELIEVLGLAEAQERENRQLERAAVRYWTLEYLRRRPAETVYTAVLLPGNQGCLVELPDFVTRGRLTRTAEGKKGARVEVRLVEADPDRDRLLLEPV